MSGASPQRLGDFEIAREIGRGGMGVVYEALQVSLNRRVALKVLSGGLGLTPNAVQRFRREAEAAAKLHHTNIVSVYATGEQDGTHFYAMELIDGPSLDHVIKQMRQASPGREPLVEMPPADGASAPPEADVTGSPDLALTGPYVEGASTSGSTAGQSSSILGSGRGYFDSTARMVAEVADALAYAHREGVVHRDIKPSNLLLSPAGRLSINDFGLVRMLEQPGMTLTGEFVGTPAYMSPEQITAGRTSLNHRTDIYSLGATLYELLTLHLPFTGERRDQVLTQILHKEPKRPRKVNANVPIDLETICLKAMEKDPDRRYQTAGAMGDDLRRYVNRFAISARRAGPLERLRKWVRRHPGLATGAALALGAIALACFFAVQSWRDRQEREAVDADRRAAVANARQEKLQSKQQQAVHDILMGDFKLAEQAIREAADLGASEEWVQWRRGQIAFHSGDWEEAISLLEPAIAKMPDNLAANWLLAVAYRLNREEGRSAQVARRIDSVPPSTEEEYLYRGFATMPYTPKESLMLFAKAVAARRSTIAFGTRAVCRTRLAFNQTDLRLIKDAMDDAAAAKRIREDNPMALGESVIVHYSAAILYEQSKRTKESAEAMRIALEDAEALKGFPDIPVAVNLRGTFLAHIGRNAEAISWFEECMKHKRLSRASTSHYAWLLFERGEADKAFQVMEQYTPSAKGRDPSRAIFVAELPDNGLARARKICQELAEERAVAGLFTKPLLLFFLGERAAAFHVLGQSKPERGPKDGNTLYDKVVAYWGHPSAATEKALLDLASRSKATLLHSHFHIGMRLLADGDRVAARRHFQACLALQYPLFTGSLESRALLARMDKDPAWPPWIPPKQ
jgi:serine/threonine protein kinase